MEFGKLQTLDDVNFTLPPDAPQTTHFLSQLPDNQAVAKVYVGCTGWSTKEWVGQIYPKGTKTSQYLRCYGGQFNTIELNTTHYRIPTDATIENWRESVPSDFRFCPKLPQTISHSRDLGFGNNQISLFCRSITGLGAQLGCCFMQLPPHFKPAQLPVLEHFLAQFPKEIPLAVEVRHPDWFSNKTSGDALFDLLEKHQVSTVLTDVAGRRDVLHQRLTTATAMIRFVGNDLHPTDFERIETWVERLKSWFDKGLRQVFFFTHEPDNLNAPQLADFLVQKIQQTFVAEIRGPQFLKVPNENAQISLF